LVPDLIHHIQRATRVAALFGIVAALQGELGDGIDRKYGAGNARHAALI